MSEEKISSNKTLKVKKVEEFEMREYRIESSYYIPCKIYTVEFGDGKIQRYLVSGRRNVINVITKEDDIVGFWMDKCATYACLVNIYWDGTWKAKYGSFLADQNDIAFVDWLRETQKHA